MKIERQERKEEEEEEMNICIKVWKNILIMNVDTGQRKNIKCNVIQIKCSVKDLQDPKDRGDEEKKEGGERGGGEEYLKA